VERATHPEVLHALEGTSQAWAAHGQAVNGKLLARDRAGQLALVDWSKPFGPDCALSEERLSTRLGLSDRLVALPIRTMGPFGSPVSMMRIPGHLAAEIDEDAEPRVSASGTDLRLRLGHREFVYDRLGLRPAE